VIVSQPNHCETHRRLRLLRKQMTGDKNESKQYREKFLHKNLNWMLIQPTSQSDGEFCRGFHFAECLERQRRGMCAPRHYG
jgi:hypothetical protein